MTWQVVSPFFVNRSHESENLPHFTSTGKITGVSRTDQSVVFDATTRFRDRFELITLGLVFLDECRESTFVFAKTDSMSRCSDRECAD